MDAKLVPAWFLLASAVDAYLRFELARYRCFLNSGPALFRGTARDEKEMSRLFLFYNLQRIFLGGVRREKF
jgi:hypothetical protein